MKKNIRRITMDYHCLSINDIGLLERVDTKDKSNVPVFIITQEEPSIFYVRQIFAKGLVDGMTDKDKKYSIVLYEY